MEKDIKILDKHPLGGREKTISIFRVFNGIGAGILIFGLILGFSGAASAYESASIQSASTDKPSYDPWEAVKVSVTIKNTGDVSLSDLNITANLTDPDGANVKTGILESGINLDPGQTYSTGYIDYWNIPNDAVPGIYTLEVELCSSGGAICYDTEYQDFTVSSTSLEIKDIIVRTPRNIDFSDEQSVNYIIDSLKQTCVDEITVLVKQDGDDAQEKDASGVILKPGNLFYGNTAYADAKANMNYDVLQKFIDTAHANGIKVNAWIPVFKDKVARGAHPEWGLSGLGEAIYFIDPSNPEAREYELNIIYEILNYDIDGIRLDYVRYTDGQGSTDDLVTFLGEVEDLVNSEKPGIEVDVYVFPVEGQCIMPNNCFFCPTTDVWSKQDYSRFKEHADHLMPMIYWQDWAEEINFECWINNNIYQSQKLTHSKTIPVFSVTNYTPSWSTEYMSEEEIEYYLQRSSSIAKENGVDNVSLFYYFKWTETELNRMNAVESSCVQPPPQPPDVVDITDAVYNTAKKELSIKATSSKGGDAVLTVEGFGIMEYNSKRDLYQLKVSEVANPGTVTVASSLGGADTENVAAKGKKGK